MLSSAPSLSRLAVSLSLSRSVPSFGDVDSVLLYCVSSSTAFYKSTTRDIS